MSCDTNIIEEFGICERISDGQNWQFIAVRADRVAISVEMWGDVKERWDRHVFFVYMVVG